MSRGLSGTGRLRGGDAVMSRGAAGSGGHREGIPGRFRGGGQRRGRQGRRGGYYGRGLRERTWGRGGFRAVLGWFQGRSSGTGRE